MAAPVWVLSVDLQTRTATFQSGMSDAAKSARGSFNDIKSGASEMGRETSGSMMEARHSVMLLGEEFGVHLPRALTTFIAGLGPIGAAMSAAFPFLAIVVGATLLIEHLQKVKEEGEKLTESQMAFGTTVANVMNQLDEKLLQAGIRTDELNGNHLAALEKQLQLIDHQSLKELEHSFEEIAKSSDVTMALLKTHWYEFDSGADGAKHALDEFKSKYELLLAQGKDKEASDFLAGTLKSAERIREMQSQMIDNQAHSDSTGKLTGNYEKYVEAHKALKDAGTGISDKEIQAQVQLVEALQMQVEAEQKVHDLKKLEESNARTGTQNRIDADDDKLARERMQEQKRLQEEQDKADEQSYREAVARIQEAERLKIDATEKGSNERLAAIDAAIKDEQSKGLQETNFYKDLLAQRVNLATEIAQEQKKLSADAAKEEADHTEKMGMLKVEADRQASALALATRKKGDEERVKSDEALADEEFQVKLKASQAEIAALDKTGKDYENKLKQLQDRQTELIQAHENQVTAIREKAEIDRASRIESAEKRLNDSIVHGLTEVLMRHQSFTSMLNSLGSEVVAGMLKNAELMITADGRTKAHDAAFAARQGFKAGTHFPFPLNLVMPEVLAAGFFSSVMAFAEGGLVPGVGLGDIQPAMLTPGELVIPKQMTERLSRASDDSGNSGQHVHVHHHATYHINAVDGASVEGMLNKHADKFHKHVEHTLRKMNR